MTTISWWWQGSHEETERHLSDQLEGELRGFRRLRILRHLAGCEMCAAAFASLLRTVEGLRTLGRPEPASEPSIADAVVERIQHDQERER